MHTATRIEEVPRSAGCRVIVEHVIGQSKVAIRVVDSPAVCSTTPTGALGDAILNGQPIEGYRS